MGKKDLAYDLALAYAKCALEGHIQNVFDPEANAIDAKKLLIIYFEEAYVYYVSHPELLDFSNVECA